jgi:hypothetical protein
MGFPRRMAVAESASSPDRTRLTGRLVLFAAIGRMDTSANSGLSDIDEIRLLGWIECDLYTAHSAACCCDVQLDERRSRETQSHRTLKR